MDEFRTLTGVFRADAAIVGGGWTGLLTAFFLSGRGLRVTLLSRSAPCSGDGVLLATLHRPDVCRRIAAWHGMDTLRAHLSTLRRLMSRLPGWLTPLAPFREAEIYAHARTPAEIPCLLGQLELLQELGLPAEPAPDAGGCPYPVELSYRSPALLLDAAPLADALCQGILRTGGRIFADSRVVNATARQVFTIDGRVDAPLVLLCTGKPLGLTGQRMLSLLRTNTLVRCRAKPTVPLHHAHTAIQPGGLTLVPAPTGAEALWDAGLTGTREELERTAIFQRILRRRLPEWEASPPSFRLQTSSLDGLPVVGRLNSEHGWLLFAAGAEDFPGALLSAQTLARLALRIPREEDLLLRPDRPLPHRLIRQAGLQLRRQRIVNSLHRLAPRCCHCGGRLRYHPAARWWGCPACGSAFGMLGQRLGGPALHDASISAVQRPGW